GTSKLLVACCLFIPGEFLSQIKRVSWPVFSEFGVSFCRMTLPPTEIGQLLPRQGTLSQGPYSVFHPFSELPAELRRKIWLEYLRDATPQIYRFTLRFPRRGGPWIVVRPPANPKDDAFLQPSSTDLCPNDGRNFALQPLIASTAASRTASAT